MSAGTAVLSSVACHRLDFVQDPVSIEFVSEASDEDTDLQTERCVFLKILWDFGE